jgi:hypothetical protein
MKVTEFKKELFAKIAAYRQEWTLQNLAVDIMSSDTIRGLPHCDMILMDVVRGKRLLGRPRHRWKDNIKIDLQEVG